MRILGITLTWLACTTQWALPQAALPPYQEALSYTMDQPRTVLVKLEQEMRTAPVSERARIEKRLLATLRAPQATVDCKRWVCRQLRQYGSAQCVNDLEPLLADPHLALDARWALQSIPGPEVDAALRRMLQKTKGLLQVGIIQTIGARARDSQAVPLLDSLLNSEDPQVVEAALHALGHLGGEQALRALRQAQVAETLAPHRWHALMLCAEKQAAEGHKIEAAQIYAEVFRSTRMPILRTGALRGWIQNDPEGAVPALGKALKSSRPELAKAAAQLACESKNSQVIKAAHKLWPELAAEVRVTLLEAARDPSVAALAERAARAPTPPVQVAALHALTRWGNAGHVPLFLEMAQAEHPEVREAARHGLARLRGSGVNDALITALTDPKGSVRAVAAAALAERAARQAVPPLLRLADDTEVTVRIEALKALAELAEVEQLPALVGWLTEAKTRPELNQVERTLTAVTQRASDADQAAATLWKLAADQPAAVQAVLIEVLAGLHTPKALEALRAALQSASPQVRKAATRGLAQWPDREVLPDLRQLVLKAATPADRALALRSLIRLCSEAPTGPRGEDLDLLAWVLSMNPQAGEKKTLLAALGKSKDPRALELAQQCLSDRAVELEAAQTVVQLARRFQKHDPKVASAAVKKILEVCQSPEARQLAQNQFMLLHEWINIAPRGRASSPDGLEKDGAASGDQAAIDGNPNTYWDEQDGAKLYRLVVTFERPQTIAGIGIRGYRHHDYAPRDFQILCDGKVVKEVRRAKYEENYLAVPFDEVRCQTLELKMTGYYGRSPAIRELEIYSRAQDRK